MRRTIPACPECKPEVSTYHPNAIPRTYTIEVITPLFGGGVETGVNDPATLIRSPSIRGHLRFWWRATQGGRLETVEALRQREAEIWGSTKISSKVTVCVDCTNRGNGFAVGAFREERAQNGRIKHPFNFDIPPYAAFPFRPQYDDNKDLQENNNRVARVRKGIEFTLRLDFPHALQENVNAAITAWVNFGGIGARTRRGFGGLYCHKLAPQNTNSFDAFIKALGASETNAASWPFIFHRYYLGSQKKLDAQKDAYSAAWREGIEKLQAFRQLPPVGRRAGSGRKHGRSYWPEAEAVRNLVFAQRETAGMFSGSRSAINPSGWHEPDLDLSELCDHGVYFPRAEFGLPIIWEIKDERLPGSGDNLKPTLQYDEKHDRLASPLIIRPIRFQDGTISPLFLELLTRPLDGAYLKPGGEGTDLINFENISSSQIRDSALARYPCSPLGAPASGGSVRSTNGSALEAFFKFLEPGRG